MSHENEIAAAKPSRLLDGDDVGGRFYDAELRDVPLIRRASGAQFAFRQHAAALAMPDGAEGLRQSLRENPAAVAIALQQIKGHALRRLRADARQTSQGIDQAGQCGRVFHRRLGIGQNGSFIPGGRLRPDMRPAYFSWLCAANLCTASLMAATTRSSSMSLSSPRSLGVMVMLLASWRPLSTILTMPAPDSPVTSRSASSACAFCMVSCICCAWRIKFPNPPFNIRDASSC